MSDPLSAKDLNLVAKELRLEMEIEYHPHAKTSNKWEAYIIAPERKGKGGGRGRREGVRYPYRKYAGTPYHGKGSTPDRALKAAMKDLWDDRWDLIQAEAGFHPPSVEDAIIGIIR